MYTMSSKFLAVLVFAFLASQVNSAAINNGTGKEPAAMVNFGTALKDFYLAFQRIMPCGYAPLEIPVLAPFTMDYHRINYTSNFYNLSGDLSNVMVAGLDDFEFLGTSFNATTNRFTYDIIFPEIQLLGECELDVMAHFDTFPFEMDNSGLLNMKMIDYRIVGAFTMSPKDNNGTESMQMSDVSMRFYIGDAIFNNWNNLWDISVNNFANKWSREFVLMWSQQIQTYMDQFYAHMVLPIVNEMLSGVSMAEYEAFLVNQTMEFNKVNCTM